MYLMGEVTELDEEPSYLITNCYQVTGKDGELIFEKYPLYSDQRDLFLTSDVVVETLATDPKRGNIHLFACLVNHASVAWILSLTGCL